jgi:hypothetical protein
LLGKFSLACQGKEQDSTGLAWKDVPDLTFRENLWMQTGYKLVDM